MFSLQRPHATRPGATLLRREGLGELRWPALTSLRAAFQVLRSPAMRRSAAMCPSNARRPSFVRETAVVRRWSSRLAEEDFVTLTYPISARLRRVLERFASDSSSVVRRTENSAASTGRKSPHMRSRLGAWICSSNRASLTTAQLAIVFALVQAAAEPHADERRSRSRPYPL